MKYLIVASRKPHTNKYYQWPLLLFTQYAFIGLSHFIASSETQWRKKLAKN